jgi:hypothetical protein
MKVFLSHANESKPQVRRLTDGLPKHVERWLDAEELATGQKFPQHIEAGIRNECDFFLVFIDEAALQSEWVKREVALGRERQRDLQRPFVLPILVGDVQARMGELGLAADEWLYLDARDLSDTGVAASGAAIAAELFKHASELVERLRTTDRRSLIDGFAAELAEFEQVAYRWVAAMENRIDVLVTVQAAIDHVRETLAAYNQVADRFIPRLPKHRDALSAAWHDRRSFINRIAALIDLVEDGVYRGAMYDLNEVLGLVHEAQVADAEKRLDPAQLAKDEQRKTVLIDQAQAVLDDLTQRANALFGDLTAELEQ